MKRFLKLLSLVLCLAMLVCVFAACDDSGETSVDQPEGKNTIGGENIQNNLAGNNDFEPDSSPATPGLSYRLLNDNTYEVSVGTAKDVSEIVIPSIYDGKPVTRIADSAFYLCNNLKNITIYNRMTSIGNSAFYGCVNLKSIDIPNSVTEIGRSAFQNCSALTSVTLSSEIKVIDDYTFSGCSSLNNVIIPSNITSIKFEAFQGCTNLSNITVPDSVTSIGMNVFGNTAYYNTESNWENSVLYLGNHLIKATESISENYTIRPGTKSIASNAFDGCAVTSIVLPEGLKGIEKYAFNACYGLTSITIPNSVIHIGKDAFNYTEYYFNDNNWQDGVLYLGNYLIQAKQTFSGDYTIKAGTKLIAESAFEGCSDLTGITIPDSVISIGASAFSCCKGLANLTVGSENSVYQSIDGNLYHKTDAKLLQYAIGKTETSFTIPDGIASIGDSAFYCVTNLTSITLSNDVTSIGKSAFEGASNLTTITIPNSITSLRGTTFTFCDSLTDIYFTGTEKEWSALVYLLPNGKWNVSIPYSATVHFNYLPEEN